MMDDESVNRLARALVDVETYAPQVVDLMTPRVPCSGEGAFKPPTRAGSKPPLVVAMVDLHIWVEAVVVGWSSNLQADAVAAGCSVTAFPRERDVVEHARWLRENVWELAEMPWSGIARDEVVACAQLLADVVSPPLSPGDPKPVEFGTAREIAAWCRHLGVRVSRSTIQRWVGAGRVPSQRLDDGRVLIRLSDVLAVARGG